MVKTFPVQDGTMAANLNFYKSFKKDLLYDGNQLSISQTFFQATVNILIAGRRNHTNMDLIKIVPSKGRGIISSDESSIVYQYELK